MDKGRREYIFALYARSARFARLAYAFFFFVLGGYKDIGSLGRSLIGKNN